MLKINLSGNKEKKQSEKTVIVAPVQAPKEDDQRNSVTVPDETQEVIVEEEKPAQNKKRQTVLFVILLLVALGAAGYYYKDKIMGFFPKKAPVVSPVVPPPPPSQPKQVEEKKEPDPAFVLLNRLGESITPHVWLTSAVIKYDGSYQISGLAFSFKSMTDMISLLEKMGTVTSKKVPPQSKSADTVYKFTASGILGGLKVPEVLDAIPTDKLVATAETVKSREKEFGVRFIQLPKAGVAYKDNDMQFSIEGSYTGLKSIVEILCTEGGDVRIFNLRISPSTPGGSFDRVKASFSLKSTSSI